MEPVTFTIAIFAALGWGVVAGVGQAVGGEPVKDAYRTLKAVLTNRFGNDSAIVNTVDMLEKRPDSEALKEVLKEEAEIAGVDQDPEVQQAVQQLIDQLSAQPDGEHHIQNAVGSYIAQADHGSTATVDVDVTRERPKD